jgi:hypothetical protein
MMHLAATPILQQYMVNMCVCVLPPPIHQQRQPVHMALLLVKTAKKQRYVARLALLVVRG